MKYTVSHPGRLVFKRTIVNERLDVAVKRLSHEYRAEVSAKGMFGLYCCAHICKPVVKLCLKGISSVVRQRLQRPKQ